MTLAANINQQFLKLLCLAVFPFLIISCSETQKTPSKDGDDGEIAIIKIESNYTNIQNKFDFDASANNEYMVQVCDAVGPKKGGGYIKDCNRPQRQICAELNAVGSDPIPSDHINLNSFFALTTRLDKLKPDFGLRTLHWTSVDKEQQRELAAFILETFWVDDPAKSSPIAYDLGRILYKQEHPEDKLHIEKAVIDLPGLPQTSHVLYRSIYKPELDFKSSNYFPSMWFYFTDPKINPDSLSKWSRQMVLDGEIMVWHNRLLAKKRGRRFIGELESRHLSKGFFILRPLCEVERIKK